MKQPIVIRIYKENKLKDVKQFDVPQIVIGRGEGGQIDLDDNDVSKLHAVIEERDSGFCIYDLGSSSGTKKNGNRVLDESLESGDVLEIGPYKIEFFIGVPRPVRAPRLSEAASIGDKAEEEQKQETKKEEIKEVKQEAKQEAAPEVEKEVKQEAKQEAAPEVEKEVKQEAKKEETSSEPLFDEKASSSKENVVINADIEEVTAERIPDKIPSIHEEGKVTRSQGFREPEVPPLIEPVTTDIVAAKNKRTFAPPSEFKNLKEVLRPSKGTVVEVIVSWKERVLGTYHFNKKGIVKIGRRLGNDISVPVLGVNSNISVRIDSMATVCVTSDMSGELISKSGSRSLGELIRSNQVAAKKKGYEIKIVQGEMLRVSFQGGLINFYIRYVPEAPKPLVAPFLDLSTSEVTGVILATVVTLVFGLYMMLYSPKKLEDEALMEEPLRKAVVTFKPPKVAPVKKRKVESNKKKKKALKVVKNKKKSKSFMPKMDKKSKKKIAKIARARPNRNKTKKKAFTSTRSGGAMKTGKKGASPSSEKVDVSKTGLLGVFGRRGTQKKLDKAYTGSGELQGMADSATGFAGDTESRAGDNLGSKLKSTGAGGKGASTIGIKGVGTTGKTSGTFGYGAGAIRKKGKVEVEISDQGAEFIGSMDREAIRRVILSNKKVIRNCYERALRRSPNLYGKLVIQWDIEERGKVTNAKVVKGTIKNKMLMQCLIKRLRSWIFPEPPPDQIGRVTYPFIFTSQ